MPVSASTTVPSSTAPMCACRSGTVVFLALGQRDILQRFDNPGLLLAVDADGIAARGQPGEAIAAIRGRVATAAACRRMVS